jgi:Ca-activated chloride channel family protein
MKLLSLIGIFILSGVSYGQVWRDSLQSARNAYFSKKYDLAARAYLHAEKELNGKTDLSIEKGQNAYRNGNYTGAADQFKKCLKKAKTIQNKVQANYNLGNAYFKQKRYQEAIRSYKNTLRIDPFNKEARYNLSQALRKLQQSKNKQKPKDPNKKDPDPKNKKQNKDKNKKDSPKNERSKAKEESRNGNAQRKNAANRILDKLQKDEAATKRKLNNARIKRNTTAKTSEYDW